MNYLSVAETAKKWNISERSVRNYCAQERIPGAVLIGKTWHIPENMGKPARSNGQKTPVKTLLSILQEEKRTKYAGGIYHKTQIDLTYNSNHIEGSWAQRKVSARTAGADTAAVIVLAVWIPEWARCTSWCPRFVRAATFRSSSQSASAVKPCSYRWFRKSLCKACLPGKWRSLRIVSALKIYPEARSAR